MTNPRITLPRAPDVCKIVRYLKFISNIKSSTDYHLRVRGKGFELHHIIPTKVGGNNSPINTVLLSYREHFIAHRLLLKAFPSFKEFQRAVWCMSHTRGLKVSSRTFEHLKKECEDGLKTNLGKQFTDEHKRLIGVAHKGKVVSDKTKDKLRQKATGRKHTDRTKEKCAEAAKTSSGFSGKVHPPEWRIAHSETLKGRKWWHRETDEGIERAKSVDVPDGNGWKRGKGKNKR